MFSEQHPPAHHQHSHSSQYNRSRRASGYISASERAAQEAAGGAGREPGLGRDAARDAGSGPGQGGACSNAASSTGPGAGSGPGAGVGERGVGAGRGQPSEKHHAQLHHSDTSLGPEDSFIDAMALGNVLIYDAELPAALLASTTELFLKLLLQILQVSRILTLVPLLISLITRVETFMRVDRFKYAHKMRIKFVKYASNMRVKYYIFKQNNALKQLLSS